MNIYEYLLLPNLFTTQSDVLTNSSQEFLQVLGTIVVMPELHPQQSSDSE